MKNLKFTLSPGDIEALNDAIQKQGSLSELALVFSLLEIQDRSVNITMCDEEEEFELDELLKDLNLDPADNVSSPFDEDDWEKPKNTVEFIQDFDLDVDFNDLSEKADREIELDPKVKMMTPEPALEPALEPAPEPALEPDTKKVSHGWDARVPRFTPEVKPALEPALEPDFKPQINVIPEVHKSGGFNPTPNEEPTVAPSNVPDKPTPAPAMPKRFEPDFDKDEVCGGCGGFLAINHHTDVNMNCDCGADPYTPEENANPEPTPASKPSGWNANTWHTGM